VSSDKTFGAWLLDQGARQDSIGSMSRAWKTLKEARGLKHNKAESIREILSAQMGEIWAQMQGDQVFAAAEAEWQGDDGRPQGAMDIPMALAGPAPAVSLPVAVEGEGMHTSGTLDYAPDGKVVLVINGSDITLPPGRYELAIVLSVAPEPGGTIFELPQAAQEYVPEGYQFMGTMPGGVPLGQPTPWQQPEQRLDPLPQGEINWSGLYRSADINVPDDVDRSTLGLSEE